MNLLREGPIRVVTAAALFDGHDAAIHIVRRMLQAQGAEVIHLGHDRSVEEITRAAVQEDAHAVAVSSYQGGHMEFFRYLAEQLEEAGAGDVGIYGGGGGTITSGEAADLAALGIRIFDLETARSLGLEGMIRELIGRAREAGARGLGDSVERLAAGATAAIARTISVLENEAEIAPAQLAELRRALDARRKRAAAPVIGFTGTGGAGKSSVVDELLARFRRDDPDCTIGVLLIDPSRRRSGGALLGDRIRLNAIDSPRVYVRSIATRHAHRALSRTLGDALRVLQAADFDLILVETAGIGQSDSEIVDFASCSVYVMTPDYGAPLQLEKIDMLDLAGLVVLNKFDRQGAQDALRDVRRQWRRNRGESGSSGGATPVYATVARQWNDSGIDRLYAALRARLAGRNPEAETEGEEPLRDELVPAHRARYLGEIAEAVRRWHADTERLAALAAQAQAFERARQSLEAAALPALCQPEEANLRDALARHSAAALQALPESDRAALQDWPALNQRYAAESQTYRVRDQVHSVENHAITASGTRLPKVTRPATQEWPDLLRYMRRENLPGAFPFTGGVFPFRREGEEPVRMFAGEGTPERTNRRFHLITRGQRAVRLSTAFDSVTLYGRDPDERPDIFGKIGNSGVSACTVDDVVKLYSGFDLTSPDTSVSMTINGPAPIVLAFFFDAAIDQGIERHLREVGRLEAARAAHAVHALPRYVGALPEGHDGRGLALLGLSGSDLVEADTYARIRADVLKRIRGTVQADILKEDQAQNTCIFSTDFALKLMGDIQSSFIQRSIENFYSVSVSGYHMAEAGAGPITQLAFTLANAFTYCEYYMARGMAIDDFAANFSFFFSNGMDAEYNVLGRVARRIWAIAMREYYGAGERAQKLKYHVQTSGRSLHAREMAFNDIRTTLQALSALEDRCDSLHTNAYDEAVTTPTEASVRRALAIQMIIQRELGLSRNENPLQGSFTIEALTDLVEEAVLCEFDRLSVRGGVLGAMETLYQRSKIQEESFHYEMRKDSGELPIIGVNTFESDTSGGVENVDALTRSSESERRAQLAALRAFHARHADRAPQALRKLQEVARARGNVFEALLETVRVASLGQISDALFAVGGRYRRSL